MSKKHLSLLLSVAAIGVDVYNYNGALSNQFNGPTYYVSLAVPVVMGIVAFVLGIMAWIESRREDVQDKCD